LFIGLVAKNKDLYTFLQEAGFTLVFKETVCGGDGKIKGNCDADLVLFTARDAYENTYKKAVIVSSDGDYASLVKFLCEKEKLRILLSPSKSKQCSILLKRTNAPIAYINDQRRVLELKRKNPQ
jgi:Uncharacterized conserved protein